MWKEHFKNLLGNSPKVVDKLIITFTDRQLETKLGQFTEEELNGVLPKIKSRKAEGLDEIPPEEWETSKFENFFDFATPYINKIQ